MPELLKQKERPLRFAYPVLYTFLLAELEPLNIHAFDIEAGAIKRNQGIEITLRFGENFNHVTQCIFTNQALQPPLNDVKIFFKQSAVFCHRAIVADYYKMMKP